MGDSMSYIAFWSFSPVQSFVFDMEVFIPQPGAGTSAHEVEAQGVLTTGPREVLRVI